MRTLGQKRSEYALREILEIIDEIKDKKAFASFASFVSSVPSMILQNGFGQTLAFLYSKGSDKHLKILNITKKWLEEEQLIKKANDVKDMILKISNLSQSEYLAAQKETLSLLEWVKRYAQAFKEEKNNDSNDSNDSDS